LKTIKNTPARPNRHPYIKYLVILSSFVRKWETSPVSIGAVETSRETLDAVLRDSAKFSHIKYKVTPRRPASANLTSSRKFMGQIILGLIARKIRYAMTFL
jgi:hypothetical protein